MIFDLIESVKDYKVLFVGDTIIDEYHYVRPLGKSPKENLIPVAYESSEVFRGGVEAAANHCRSFCKEVQIWTRPPAIRKVRYVEKTYLRKLFEVHSEVALQEPKPPLLDDQDVIVITDFGHGFIRRVWSDDLFVAVNAQTNSANVGFNLITKYARADYVVIDEPEARLAAADRHSCMEDVIRKLAVGHFNKMIVTHGSHGAIGWEDGKGFSYCSAFTDKVVDTMGAGDAFFAVTAPMAKTGSIPDLLRIGNAAGALKTQIVGHRKSVTKEELIEYLKAHP